MVTIPSVVAQSNRRRAYLLHRLANAPKGGLTASAADKITPAIQKELELTPEGAKRLREELAQEGMASSSKVGRSLKTEITDAGRELLREIGRFIPLQPARGEVIEADERISRSREAYLLLQLLQVPESGATASELNKKPGPGFLELNSATARHVRGQLVVRELVDIHRSARSEKFTLNPSAARHLAALSFDNFEKLEINGRALTALLAAAREGTLAVAAREPATPSTKLVKATPSSEDLETAVTEIFEVLLRERFANIRMVPIHEVRTAMAERFGPPTASHGVFDEVMHDLRRSGKARLIPIDDRSRATEQQLRDSIDAPVGTLFYVEKIDALASV